MTRMVRVRYREVDVPTSWAEGEAMIAHAMKHQAGRGHNTALQAICAKVAYGMFGEAFLAAEPTQALCYLIQRICERKGAGLDGPK